MASPSRRTIGVLLAFGLAGCSSGGSSDSGPNSPADVSVPSTSSQPPATSTTTTTSTSPPSTTTTTTLPPELTPRQVLATVGPSVVFLETEYGTGTGFAIADGYILTNAHVVTPFNMVDVTPSGGDLIKDVPVVGVDFAADLALLGPLAEPLPALALDGQIVEGGDEVFLIGYPSETESSPTPSIARGIVSRLRGLDEFDQTYIQTDADIAAGQSGGALIDRFGDLVGISGMSLDEAFALVLSIADVASRLDKLRDGGDPWQPYPTEGVTSGTSTVPGVLSTSALLLPISDQAAELTFAVDGPDDLAIVVLLDDGQSFVTRNAITLAAEQYGLTEDEMLMGAPDGYVLESGPDGSYSIDVPADSGVMIVLARAVTDEPVEVSFTSNLPLAILVDNDDAATISLGDRLEGIIEPLEFQDIFSIDLTAGQSIEITAASPTGDMTFCVLAPGERFSPDSFTINDSDVGLGGLDASDTFTAEVDGRYRIIVADLTGQSGYWISVI